MKVFALVAILLISLVSAEVYFSENFDENWEDRWVRSNNKGSDAGDWEFTNGGLATVEDYRFYQVSSGFDEFSNEGKTLVFQFSVRHAQNIDCGGGYLKILPAGLDQENFSGDSDYNIMFGPDICGSGTRRVHVIFNYKGENYLINHNIPCETDTFTHTYTLIVEPNQDYTVKIDNEEVRSGNLADDWDFLPPKEIEDPSISKPEDWVDEMEIVDPEDVKPEGWDDIPQYISNPEAEQPEDWDTELDGDWEAPEMPNPEYQGEWEPRMIPNPDYVGPWEHPLIANPNYEHDDQIYKYNSNAFVGIEIWQVKAGTIFDNVLITDDVEAASVAAGAINEAREQEIAVFELEEQERRAQEEEERARLEQELGDVDELEDELDSHDHQHDEL